MAMKGVVLTVSQQRVIEAVKDELLRQDEEKGGPSNYRPAAWIVDLEWEVEKVARAFVGGEEGNYRTALIQVAVLAISAVDAYDRGTPWDYE